MSQDIFTPDWNNAVAVKLKELRDEFAMAALTGLLAVKAMQANSCEDIAMWAYKQADAMMEARDAKE